MPPPLTLLIAEDDSNDRILLEQLLGPVPQTSLQFVENGDVLVDYLAGQARFSDRNRFPFPDVLLLDLGLPGRSGFEVLDWMAQAASLPRLSIYILTGSDDPNHRRIAEQRGVAGYFVKPLTLGHVASIVEDCVANRG
ncbi:MAG: two-component system response regulator [Verrucomicrobia bacterium]|nr:two-component system response regulator [Verrucomicrobiota bacterium]